MSENGNISLSSIHEIDFHLCDNYFPGMLILAIFSTIISVFGFPACVLVLWELGQRHRRGTPPTPNDVFMLNLTVMDLVFLGFVLFNVCNYLFWHNLTLAKGSNFLYAFCMTGRPLFMACICLDCYLAVVHPIMYRARKGLTSRVLMCVVVWAVTLAYGVMYVQNSLETMRREITIFPFAVVTLTTGICDFFILRALKSSDPAGRGLHPQKKKALQIIINSLVITVITYLPQILLFVVDKAMLLDKAMLICIVNVPFLILTESSGVAMPVLYLRNLGKLDPVWRWCHKTFSTMKLSLPSKH